MLLSLLQRCGCALSLLMVAAAALLPAGVGQTAFAAAASSSTSSKSTEDYEARFSTTEGSTRGFSTPNPVWGAGLQIGSFYGFGATAERVGFAGGALNLGLGHGSEGIGLNISADYIRFFTPGFVLMNLRDSATYNDFRGQVNPYIGGGADISEGGLGLRVPVGVQYTMLRDPYTFFGGVALAVGPFFGSDTAKAFLWLNLGARLLI